MKIVASDYMIMVASLLAAVLGVPRQKGKKEDWQGIIITLCLCSMLGSTILGVPFVTSMEPQQCGAEIYFDKTIYYEDARVFWEPSFPVQIEIRVVDRDVDSNSVTVNVSTSVDSKDVLLTRNVFGIFSGTVSVVGLGLTAVPNSTSRHLSARYGDMIVAEYFDESCASNPTANALFLFPHYVWRTWQKHPSNWESSSKCVFDSDGVPMVNLHYNPVTISQYALANYHEYMYTGNTSRREKFLAQAKWLFQNAKQKENYSVWEYDFDLPSYGCTRPWVSAMAQGQGLSVLTRAYVLTENVSYIDVAEEIIRAFQVEMSDGGVRYTDCDGVWFEECADLEAPSGKVLNGFIAALLGLYECSFETNNTIGWQSFWEGTETLANNLYRYDSGTWSYYDLLHHHHAPLNYHKIHIEQLETLHELTGNYVFLNYSRKFQSYMSSPPPPPPPHVPENSLTIYALPSRVTFTVDSTTQVTPWSDTYQAGALVDLVMPETYTVGHATYSWDQWSDGNTSRARTFTMDTNITLAGYFDGPYGPIQNLDTGKYYFTIQEAINDASKGDEIFVPSGTYCENLVVNKTVSLTGQDKHNTIVEGNCPGRATLILNASDINVTGFTIRNDQLPPGSTSKSNGGILILESSSCNVIADNIIVNNTFGIFLSNSSRNTLMANTVLSNNVTGIWLYRSNNNVITSNNIVANGYDGILLNRSCHNNISQNYITKNECGISFSIASDNSIHHNDFSDNVAHTYDYSSENTILPSVNKWDADYPRGGNYWSNYNGTDFFCGHHQNEAGSDCVGDTPYIIDEYNTDNYPLLVPYLSGDVNSDHLVDVCDFTIISSAVPSAPRMPLWDLRADVNRDGVVDVDDLVICIGNIPSHW